MEMEKIKYLGIKLHKANGPPPTSTYYNIPTEYCYEVFDAISGGIIALVDSSNYSNSVCIKNPLFIPTGISDDELPLNESVVCRIINHVLDMTDGVSIIEVLDDDLVLFDRCDTTDDIIPTIDRRVRENKINSILK